MPTTTDYVAFDLETTGLSPKADRIVEIGAVRFDSGFAKVAELELLVDPGIPIPLAIQRLTGLHDRDVHGQPSPLEGVAQLADFCEGAQLVAHGSGFDMTFCAGLVPDAFARRSVLDTLEVARILMPTAASHSLPLLSGELGITHERPHRAFSDAQATWLLLETLAETAAALPVETLAQMRRVAAQTAWPIGDLLAAVPGNGDPARDPWRGRPPAPQRAEAGRTELPAGLVAATSALLGPGGPIADRPGWELREEQEQMAVAIAQALERRRHLLAEAGTGVGKSLAYLAPLALWAASGERRGVVATRTITLQEQLFSTELPRLQEHLPVPVSAALLKGRSHYISLRRWQRWLQRSDLHAHGVDWEALRFKLKVLAWLAETGTGDRAELRLGSIEEQLWRNIESDSADCLGRTCANWGSARCWMVRARRTAADAQLVITNQALLLADAEAQGEVLGAHAAVVVDEAHHLEEVATEQLGLRVRAADLLVVIDRIPPLPDGPLAIALEAAREGTVRLFGELKGFCGEILGGDGGASTVSLTAELRQQRRWQLLLRHARSALEAWDAAVLALRAGSGVDAGLLPQPDSADSELELAAAALDVLAAGVHAVLLADGGGPIAWLQLRAEQVELRQAPVDVAGRLRERLFDAADTAVLTSATLAVAGDFGFVRERLGVPSSTEEILLDSPFDYLRQALTVVVRDLPPYDAAEYDSALAELLAGIALRLGGRTLALFTGYGPLKRIHGLLSQRLEDEGIALLGQGLDGTRRQLLASFVANPSTVLLGTNSFWEGIDIPGDALQCVLIAKLPFAVPTDPLVAARAAHLRDPFRQLVLPQAVIRLRQGFGRLIRHGTDRGAVVLCDERLRSREYGTAFLQALPQAATAERVSRDVPALVEDFVRHGIIPEGASPGARGAPAWRIVDDEPA